MASRAKLILLLGLALLLPAHASRQVLQSGPGGCVAPADSSLVQSTVNCIGVVQVSYKACQNVARYQGQSIPYIENAQNTICYIPYGSDCPSSITILLNEGNGQFTNCNSQTTATAVSFAKNLIAQIKTQQTSQQTATTGSSGALPNPLASVNAASAVQFGNQVTTDEANIASEGLANSGAAVGR